MRIGIVTSIDKYTLLPFVREEDRKIISELGAETGSPAVNALMVALLRTGHFIRVFTRAVRFFVVRSEKIEIYGAPYCNNYPIKYLWGDFITGHNLRTVIRQNSDDLDIIHAHWTYSYAYGALAVAGLKPIAVTVRDWASLIWRMMSWKNRITWTFKLLMSEIVFRNPHVRFIANSQYTKHLVEHKICKHVPFIPNSIKDIFIREEPHIMPSTIRVLCISSSLDKRKNVKTLLQAFKTFRKKYPEAVLQVIGRPFTMDNPIVQHWGNEGLLDGVEMTGLVFHSDLRDHIDRATLFVTPSLEETFGNTLLENMARRVPVIGGNASGAIPYVLHHGEAGFLCDVSNPQSICDMMDYVVSHSDKVSEIVEHAFSIIKSEYAQTVVCDKHIEVYKSIIYEFNHQIKYSSELKNNINRESSI